MAGSTDDRGEHCPRGVVAGETCFAHAGAIVQYQGGNVVVTHDWQGCERQKWHYSDVASFIAFQITGHSTVCSTVLQLLKAPHFSPSWGNPVTRGSPHKGTVLRNVSISCHDVIRWNVHIISRSLAPWRARTSVDTVVISFLQMDHDLKDETRFHLSSEWYVLAMATK